MLSIVLSISCSNQQINQTIKPNNLLSRQQMADIIGDIQLTEAAVTQKNYTPDSANMINAGYYDMIYANHKVSKADFESSYHYYISTPDELDSIYAKVIENLSSKESVLRGANIKKASGIRIDSAGTVTVEKPK